MKKMWVELKRKYKYGGSKHFAIHLLYQILNKLFYFECLHVMRLSMKDINSKYLSLHNGFSGKFLSSEEIEKYFLGNDSEFELPPNVLENRDECFAILENLEIASYGWYSKKPTAVTGEFKISIPQNFRYMHHGYTSEKYRGKRLHAIGMSKALQILSMNKDCDGLVSVVSAENASSLVSTERLGFVPIGKIFIIAKLNRYFVFHTKNCQSAGVSLRKNRPNIFAHFFRS